jgi:dihydrofolate reductase
MISIICAIGKNRAIGRDNKLLWDIPHDLQHFKEITSGHPVIMGRKTFDSIGRPLPGRTNIIVTRDKTYQSDKCMVCNSLEEAIEKAKEIDSQEVFVIGGGSIYAQAIDLADKLYLTIVETIHESSIPEDADTFFPEYDQFDKMVKEEHFETDKFKYTFVELIRDDS